MLIHGLFGSMDNLSMLRRDLENDFQILSVDLPDHGKSKFTQDFSYANYAQLLITLLDELDIPVLSLVGHSMGGKVAMTMALAHPKRITRLIPIDIAPVAYEPRHTNVFAGLNSVPLDTLTDRKQADEILAKAISEPGVRQFLLKSLYQTESGWHWRFNIELLFRDYDKLSGAVVSASAFTQPTLFIKGEHSDYLKAEYSKAVLALFPKSTFKIVGNTGHWLHAEKPGVCGRLIYDFLSDV